MTELSSSLRESLPRRRFKVTTSSFFKTGSVRQVAYRPRRLGQDVAKPRNFERRRRVCENSCARHAQSNPHVQICPFIHFCFGRTITQCGLAQSNRTDERMKMTQEHAHMYKAPDAVYIAWTTVVYNARACGPSRGTNGGSRSQSSLTAFE